jgi:hypothetical protein
MKRHSRTYLLLASVAALAIVGLVAPALADTVVQSFNSVGTIEPDWVVAIKPGSTDTVELAPANQSSAIYGVAIDPSEAPITLQRSDKQQVFVASSGDYPVLVSTQNGAIKSGDYLSISSTNGIAVKATNQQPAVLGRALGSFDGISGVLASGPGGSAVGLINATIAPGPDPLYKSDIAIPSPLKSIGDSLAGKNVSSLRIYTALAIFLVSVVIAFNISVVGIRSAMIAIGRNPLSRHSILNSLFQVVVVTVMILFLGTFSVYLLLKL